MGLTLRYILFACIATVANIGVQEISTRFYGGPFSLTLSIIMGTGVGLVVKYVLDKRYIFAFQTKNAAHDGRTFLLYTLMGIFTTLIFWGFEFAFDALFESRHMRYLGGVIGLAIGYVTKYQLDKRYVFRKESA